MHLLTITLHYLSTHGAAIGALFGGGAGLSVGLEFVLHKLHINSKKVAYTLLHVFSVIIALSSYYIDSSSVLPTYAGLALAAQTVHRFAVSPWYTKYIEPYLTYLSESNAASVPQSTAPVAAPATGSPVSFS